MDLSLPPQARQAMEHHVARAIHETRHTVSDDQRVARAAIAAHTRVLLETAEQQGAPLPMAEPLDQPDLPAGARGLVVRFARWLIRKCGQPVEHKAVQPRIYVMPVEQGNLFR